MRTPCLLLILLALPMLGHAQPRLTAYTLGTAMEADHASMHVSATLGQVAAGTATNGTVTLEAGFWFASDATATPIEHDDTAGIPSKVRLEQNYPNPFNPQTTITYALPQPTHVRLAVYDVLGREITLLVDKAQAAGSYRAVFEAGDLPSGIYLYRLEAGTSQKTRHMLLVK